MIYAIYLPRNKQNCVKYLIWHIPYIWCVWYDIWNIWYVPYTFSETKRIMENIGYAIYLILIYECFHLHLRNPPTRETEMILWYLAVQIQIEILNSFEFLPSNLSFWMWWFRGCNIFSGTCHKRGAISNIWYMSYAFQETKRIRIIIIRET